MHNDRVILGGTSTPEQNSYAISFRWLLRIYAVIPVILFVVAVDQLFMSGVLRSTLPSFPDQVALYAFLFNFPHILASFFPFMSKSVLVQYRKRLTVGSLLIIGIFFPLLAYDASIAYIAISIWTVLHVIFQQTGLALMFMRAPSHYYHYWKWVGGLLGCYIYIQIYPSVFFSKLILYENIVLGLGVLVICVCTLLLMRDSTTKEGRQYVAATGVMFVSVAGLFYVGYPLFAILVPRIVHDVTAFTFYITHGLNASSKKFSDSLFRVWHVPTLFVPIIIVCGSILLAHILTSGMVGKLTISIVIFLSLLHYYLDAFAWKKGSALRENIAFQA